MKLIRYIWQDDLEDHDDWLIAYAIPGEYIGLKSRVIDLCYIDVEDDRDLVFSSVSPESSDSLKGDNSIVANKLSQNYREEKYFNVDSKELKEMLGMYIVDEYTTVEDYPQTPISVEDWKLYNKLLEKVVQKIITTLPEDFI